MATYVPDRREVMNKYIDVAAPADVTLPGGRGNANAIVVTTRLGYDGERTQHYLDGTTFRWLGSRNASTGVEVVPTTRDELAEVWQGSPLWVDAPPAVQPER